ncbi:hypothetical protein TSTA_106910 [Talaromyces stipitatus ATCC 10500]|uniref:Zn(2)-C6 fungal-type domain-containing protein n=1 Tax=Talaromyces stipitatus (strain ATCC 10500 / CBS 375.48 / QM 6759 / NRRL 1006) TaxID=441959 RepID=B8MPP2_TALSN|nr:uncharacterized protein TSTA_106910 [Talaromyces stipitatus ATCC 10500]EED14481.1 hypothetical protein TSTA_106910 [Talaromyces stipitatus ATCC 10500]
MEKPPRTQTCDLQVTGVARASHHADENNSSSQGQESLEMKKIQMSFAKITLMIREIGATMSTMGDKIKGMEDKIKEMKEQHNAQILLYRTHGTTAIYALIQQMMEQRSRLAELEQSNATEWSLHPDVLPTEPYLPNSSSYQAQVQTQSPYKEVDGALPQTSSYSDHIEGGRACGRCRIRKIRCDKSRPKCVNCHNDAHACFYEGRKRRQKVTQTSCDRCLISKERCDGARPTCASCDKTLRVRVRTKHYGG